MAAYSGLAGTAIGVIVTVAALVMVIVNSPLVGEATDVRQVYLWTIVFLGGIFLAGWGLARLVSV